METSVLIPAHDMSQYINDIVVTIPDTEFRHHRGATSYHLKMILKIVLYAYTNFSQPNILILKFMLLYFEHLSL
ncbi:hypothetical protein ACXXG1_08595 [Staphylococcus epidermidis]